MPTDRRALREAWQRSLNLPHRHRVRDAQVDDLIARAIQAGRAEMLEECIAATRDGRDMYDWDDERPFDAMIERLEALKGDRMSELTSAELRETIAYRFTPCETLYSQLSPGAQVANGFSRRELFERLADALEKLAAAEVEVARLQEKLSIVDGLLKAKYLNNECAVNGCQFVRAENRLAATEAKLAAADQQIVQLRVNLGGSVIATNQNAVVAVEIGERLRQAEAHLAAVRAKLEAALEIDPRFCPSVPDKCRGCEVDPDKIEELGELLAEALSLLPPAPQDDGQEGLTQ